jgi:hypothetical protein
MLTWCSSGRVARFCRADHQKMASKKAALGGSLATGRHKDTCGVLSKWREVVKDGVAPDSCTANLAALLQQRMHAMMPNVRRGRSSSLVMGGPGRQFSRDGGPGRCPVTGGQGGDARARTPCMTTWTHMTTAFGLDSQTRGTRENRAPPLC